MAISKYTTPVQSIARTPAPRLNLQLISNTLNKLTDSQNQGVEAKSKFELARKVAEQQMLPEDRERLAPVFAKYDQKLGSMAQDGDLINAAPRISAMANELQGDVLPAAQNYSNYSKSIAEFQDLAKKDEANQADYWKNITLPRQTLKETGIFNAVSFQPRKNVPKLLDDFSKGFSDTKTDYIFDNGKWINKVTKEGVDPDKVADAMTSYLYSDPRVRDQMRTDAEYKIAHIDDAEKERLAFGMMDDLESKSQFLTEKLADIDKELSVATDQELINDLLDRKNEINRSIEANKEIANEFINDTDKGLIRADVENQVRRAIDPFVRRVADPSVTETRTADPFALFDYKENVKAINKAKSDKFTADKKGKGTEPVDIAVGMVNARNENDVFTTEVSMTEAIDAQSQTINDLISLRAKTTSKVESDSLGIQIENLKLEKARAESLYNRVLAEVGVDKSKIEAIKKGRPKVPVGIDPSTRSRLEQEARFQALEKDVLFEKSNVPWNEDEQRTYFRELKNYYSKLSDADKATDAKFNSILEREQTRSVMRSGVTFTNPSDRSTLVNLMNGFAGKEKPKTIYKDNGDGNIVAVTDKDDIESIQAVSDVRSIVPKKDGTLDVYVTTGKGTKDSPSEDFIYNIPLDEAGPFVISRMTNAVASQKDYSGRIQAIMGSFTHTFKANIISSLNPGEDITFDVNEKPAFTIKNVDGRYVFYTKDGKPYISKGNLVEFSTDTEARSYALGLIELDTIPDTSRLADRQTEAQAR